LLQKNWLEDQLVWALNVNYELEFEKEADGSYQRDGMRHPRPDSIRLKRSQRYFLYAVLALVFWSGVAWAYWNYLRSPGDFQTNAKSWAMKIHGAAATAILVLIGMLLNGHVRFAWRARRNRANGSIFLSALAVLTITGYGLYYAGGESLRAWTSWIHLAVGLALPILLVIHIFLGRRTRPTVQSSMRSRFASRGVEDRHAKSHYSESQRGS
jgi:cytochrome bd-type quinol oxidase subunit 2